MRTVHHPRRRARREGALERRTNDLKQYEVGNWTNASERSDNPGSILKAKQEVANLEAKLFKFATV